jgi:hypothetical protein
VGGADGTEELRQRLAEMMGQMADQRERAEQPMVGDDDFGL